jgi:hypothetical protein
MADPINIESGRKIGTRPRAALASLYPILPERLGKHDRQARVAEPQCGAWHSGRCGKRGHGLQIRLN